MNKFITYFIVILALPIAGQGIVFDHEDITFRLSEKYFNVDGIYWFKNNGSDYLKNLIYFPFADSNAPLLTDEIEVTDLSTGDATPFQKDSCAGIMFSVSVAAGSEHAYRIKYRVKIETDSVYYILRSTLTWKRPLASAEYKLVMEAGAWAAGFSYKPDKTYIIEGREIYYWKKENFLPQEDFVVRLKK